MQELSEWIWQNGNGFISACVYPFGLADRPSGVNVQRCSCAIAHLNLRARFVIIAKMAGDKKRLGALGYVIYCPGY